MHRFQVTGAGVREALLNRQIEAKSHAYEFGIDPEEITSWQWPFMRALATRVNLIGRWDDRGDEPWLDETSCPKRRFRRRPWSSRPVITIQTAKRSGDHLSVVGRRQQVPDGAESAARRR